MSPEQARGLNLDARSDIFSLGVVLHEMLSGKSPFAGATNADVIAAISTKEPPPITQYTPEAPEALDELKRILTLSLKKERAERYQTAREMLADLKRVKQRLEIEVELKRYPVKNDGLDNATTDEKNAVEAAARPTISAENLRPVKSYSKTEHAGIGPSHKTKVVILKRMAVMATVVLVFITTWMFLRHRPGTPAAVAQSRLSRTESVDPQAYEYYQTGIYFWNKRTDATIRKGIEYFQQAIQRDPNYALAYAGMANAYMVLGNFSRREDAEEACSKSKEMAKKALQMDEGLAEAHTALAQSLFYCDWNWADAETEFQRAIELNSNYGFAHQAYSRLLIALGRQNWVAEVKRAVELDPVSLITGGAGSSYIESGQYDLAIETIRKKLELDPNYPAAYGALGGAYRLKGMYPEAIENLKKAVDLSGGAPGPLSNLGYTYGVSGKPNEALQILQRLTLLSKRRYVSPYIFARVYVGLGEKDLAFEWLAKAVADHSIDPVNLRHAKEMDSIRSDPRYIELMRGIGLPP
jgi:tetratricopeptide (TPR) repeat protein